MNWILEKTHENGTVMYLAFPTDVSRFYIFFLFFYASLQKELFLYFNHLLHSCQLKQTPQ